MRKFLNKKIVAVLIAVVLIIGAHYLGWARPAENFLLKLLRPAEKALYRTGNALKLIYQKSASERDWETDNKRLDEENKKLLAENVGLKIIADENKVLREQLAFYSRSNYQKTVANVISRAETVGDNQVITLDRGGADGIKSGQAIVAGDGIIIGKIFFIKEKISYGCLITNEQCGLAASIVNQEGAAGLTKGELGLTVRLNFIPQTESIASSSIVITSGLEPAIPRGLIIGKITEVDAETNDLFQSAVVSPAADLNGLTVVSVIK
ncbi:rod shape-determining protein MreC [Candidatus Falkowbacteria bacterium CG10_big_fil_rev_8_21_14_0_10_43_11]|uniref:Cell shape-determining protein MreC n=1 Tax=Candidatus Falkowbacteria bacterium CG10_big_fil_rev_8_21_14_0_10_43_11 TaxID=1974568 RepID=A0A2M6WNC5_9BACT|nr:MAG: rod shape-determining protein MreC [Candidatus Falkowbacteria bacterium CG10_big_fil_rev_8_21_14_0_10_43_11]